MSDKQEGYTKEQLRIAFRHGCWLGIAAMDESVGPEHVNHSVVQAMNEWFDDWFLQAGFTTTGATAGEKSNQPENKENKEEHEEDRGDNVADR